MTHPKQRAKGRAHRITMRSHYYHDGKRDILLWWQIFPHDYDAIVERMARAMVKRRDPEITAKMTPEMAAILFAITALKAIGIAAPKGRARK